MSFSPYNSHSHASPLLDGKKNSAFQNPNLRSSNVFYDYDYSYKNDMHNPRLLSAVKNDKFTTPTKGDRLDTRSTYEKTPSEQGDRPSSAYNTPQKTWGTESNNDYYQAPANRSQRGSVPNLRVGTENPTQTRAKDFESLSTISEEPNANAFNTRGTKTTRAPGMYCLDCVNSSLAERQRCKKDAQKAIDHKHMKEWVAHEDKKAAYNQDKDRQETTIARKEKLEPKAHANYHNYTRIYGKEEPVVEGGVVIDAIFDKHEERTKQNKMNERSLRSYNMDKMIDTQANKEFEKIDRLTSQHNSLQVGEVFVNRYLPTDGSVVRDLQDQMDANAVRNARTKEAEQKRDQEILQANRIAMEKEKRAKAEKAENYKRMLHDQLNSRAQDRQADKEKQKVDNERAKYYLEKGVQEHSAKLQDKEMAVKRNKEMFMNSLKEHQVEASYRKKFEEKKNKLEGTGVTLNLGKRAETDTCDGCNKVKDKTHLTYHKH